MRYRALIVLAVSGLIGLRLGMVAFPEWQVAVETAQVTAGIVTYPAATPLFLYHVKLWTILHQILAVFLRFGFTEVQLSIALSGVLGMVSLQALAMIVFALSDDLLISLAAPLVIFVSRAADFGVVYPIFLMGSMHTYGIIGLSLMVLVVGLLGAGCYRSGAFLLGLAPAVHPSLGLWLLVLVGGAIVWDLRNMRETAGHAVKYFIAGAIVTTGSLAYQLASAYPIDPIDPALASRYLTAFVQNWDVHRQPVSMAADGVVMNRGALALALIWLIAFQRSLPKPALLLLRIVAVGAALGLLLVVVSWVPPERVPSSLLVLMPTRLVNFDAMIFVALLIGLIGTLPGSITRQILLVFFTGGLLLGDRSLLWPWLMERGSVTHLPRWAGWLDFWTVIDIAALVLVALTIAHRRRRREDEAMETAGGLDVRPPGRWPQHRNIVIACQVVFAGAAIAVLSLAWHRTAARARIFDNYETNTVFREAARGQGLLLAGGDLGLIQMRTRRPLLLNGGALDGLPYALDGGPETERILRDVYEIDYFNPPKEAYRTGVIPFRYNQMVWERFTPEKWYAIRYMFQVNQVLTSADWTLKLPVIAQDRGFRLYLIPDR